ncbi:MAG: glycosyltransferase family 4 protein [Deltaproteobacteria bacterium]|nr:glycosyltransferase family 4 protein [Deltaproteobacteria bacterium]
MRILHLLSSPRWTGPAEPMAAVAAGLARRGHQVQVAVDGVRPGDLRERLASLGFAPRGDLALSTKAAPLSYLRDLWTLRRLSGGLDVLHAHFSNDHDLALLSQVGRGRDRKVRVVRTIHSSRSLRDRAFQGLVHRRTDGLLVPCEAHARALREGFGVDPGRILVSRGAVDPVAFSPEGPDLRAELGLRPGQPVVGIVSRVKPERRHAALLAAFRPLAAERPEARLLVVGRGEGLPALRQQVTRGGLEGQVVFAGYRRGPELAAAYRTMDCKVLLAEGNDGTCRALLEAMACGRPVVAWRFGAPAEAVVDGETGRLVEPEDVAGLTAALRALLAAPETARAQGAAGRQRVLAAYGEERRAAEVEAFLERVRGLPPAMV